MTGRECPLHVFWSLRSIPVSGFQPLLFFLIIVL